MYPFASPMMMGQAAGGGILRPQDVFAISLFTGTDAALTVTTGLDHLGKGGLTWAKSRSVSGSHALFDTKRTTGNTLRSNSVNKEDVGDATYGPQAFTSSGFKLGRNNIGENPASASCVAWSFLQADKFFKFGTFTHAAGVADSIELSSLGVVGWVHIKRVDANGDWYVWTRGLSAGNNLVLNTTAAQSTTNAFISVSGTTLTFAAGAPAGTYVIEAWAHDPDPVNGIVQSGSFTTDANRNATVTLGWQPQWLLIKETSDADNWYIVDSARGFQAGADKVLIANTSAAEGTFEIASPISTGFTTTGSLALSQTFVFLAIRAPTT